MRVRSATNFAAFAGAVVLSTLCGADTKAPTIMDRMHTARELMQTGKATEALEKFINPTIAEFQLQFGNSKQRVYCSNGAVETLMYLTQAAGDNVNAIAVDAGYAYAYYMRGYIMVEQHDVPQAIESLFKAVELSPKNPQFLCELANIYQDRREWAKAMELYERAAGSAPILETDGDTFFQRRAMRGKAFILVELQKLDEAEKLYRRCLELDPKDSSATNELQYIAGLRAKNPK